MKLEKLVDFIKKEKNLGGLVAINWLEILDQWVGDEKIILKIVVISHDVHGRWLAPLL